MHNYDAKLLYPIYSASMGLGIGWLRVDFLIISKKGVKDDIWLLKNKVPKNMFIWIQKVFKGNVNIWFLKKKEKKGFHKIKMTIDLKKVKIIRKNYNVKDTYIKCFLLNFPSWDI